MGQGGGLGAGEHPRLGGLGWDGMGWDADGIGLNEIGWGWAGSPSLLLLSTACVGGWTGAGVGWG